ncbi:hypothetical protein [Kitasatospora sp. KL5]|uniref:hypothetical protein n=1 Tax=Kitasatospora sp. KL5 TaxID=3425125 RepID=UPI003D6F144F
MAHALRYEMLADRRAERTAADAQADTSAGESPRVGSSDRAADAVDEVGDVGAAVPGAGGRRFR